VAPEALPEEGGRLTREEAARLLEALAGAEVKLRDFGPARMAAHLLAEVVEGEGAVTRARLHERMRRYGALHVLRPDGYLVRVATGEAVQQVGEVVLEGGVLKAEGLEVGPFYRALEDGWLHPVRGTLEVDVDAPPAWPYQPQEGLVVHAVLGVGDSVVDVVRGLVTLVLEPVETLEGLAQLPSAVRALVEHSPEYWEAYRALPRAEQVRQASRLLAGVVLTCGTAGVGGAKAASVGGKLGRLGVPVLSLTGEGTLAVRVVAVPAGRGVTAVGEGAGAFYVVHMAGRGAGAGGGGGGAKSPVGKGPGKWVKKKPTGSEEAQRYQQQVTGRPAAEVYMVEGVEYDGFSARGVLLEAKGERYQQFFDVDGFPLSWFERGDGFKGLMKQAESQSKLAERLGVPLEWHVAEEPTAEALRKLFDREGFKNIRVIHIPLRPKR
jgi:hypothetical protein